MGGGAPVKSGIDHHRMDIASQQCAAMLSNPSETFSVPVEEMVSRAYSVADEIIKQGGGVAYYARSTRQG